jgi:hypothetical protein
MVKSGPFIKTRTDYRLWVTLRRETDPNWIRYTFGFSYDAPQPRENALSFFKLLAD